jgi:hypothetical protein
MGTCVIYKRSFITLVKRRTRAPQALGQNYPYKYSPTCTDSAQ